MENLLQYTLLGILVVINGLTLFICFKKMDRNRVWLNVLTVPILFYAVNYPLRAVITIAAGSNIIYDINIGEINLALSYSTTYFILFTYIFNKMKNKTAFIESQEKHIITYSDQDTITCHILFILVIISFSYIIATSQLYVLYGGEEGLYHPVLRSVMVIFEPLKWMVIILSYSLWKVMNRKVFLVEGTIITLLIILTSAISTAKGPFVVLVLGSLYFFNMFQIRIRTKLTAVILVLLVFVFVYSYLVRYYGIARGEFSSYQILDNITTVRDIGSDIEKIKTVGFQSLIDRFSYLDGLIIIIREHNELDRSYYILGSIVEPLNIIPRFLWGDRPLFNFNIYLTQVVWGFGPLAFSETPIGRIGESFLVMGYFGIIYSVLYAVLFVLIMKYFLAKASVFYYSIYFFILTFYVWPDSHLTFYFKTIIISLVIVYLVWQVANIISMRQKKHYPINTLQG